MGESKIKEAAKIAAIQATANKGVISVTPDQALVLNLLEVGMHSLAGVMVKVRHYNDEAGLELQKTLKHLEHLRAKLLSQCASRVVLASPGDIPPHETH